MAAKDDSVIRGSLITCIIFLVLSLALNGYFWHTADLATSDLVAAKDQLDAANTELRNKQDDAKMMKAMLGVGGLTEAEFELLSQSASGDADMEVIEKNFVRDMAIFGPEVDAQSRNYPNLPNYLVNAIRSLNDNYGNARNEATTIRLQATSDVDNARQAQALAEQDRDQTTKELEQERTKFSEDRDQMKVTTEETRDKLQRATLAMDAYRKQRSDEIAMLTRRSNQLVDTVKTQRNELNRLRNDQFESVQGLLTFVHNDGKVAHINLGSADALRPGVTFGVIDGDETRLQDAKVKASIQVTKILGEHLAETRVVSRPEIQYPLIRGDQVWSPFWVPGRVVRIAITNNIDIDGDLKPDTEALEGMIKAAGAQVVTINFADGRLDGKLDSGMRFLVVGESPVLSSSSAASDERKAQELQALGLIKADAVEKGITVIPVDKLQAYLKSISDSLTTPLGSAVRSKDFPPERIPGTQGRLPTDVADIYMKDDTGVQKNNEIARP